MLLSLAGNLLSALLGGLLVAVPSVWSTLRADRRERRNVASAFRGEIGAVLSSYDTRQYLSLHRERLQTWETTDEPVAFSRDFEERRYDQIYRANADRVGVLPDPIPQHIATFYTLLDAVHEDLRKMSRGGLRGPGSCVETRILSPFHPGDAPDAGRRPDGGG